MTEDVHNIAEPIAHLAVPIGDLVPYPRNPRRGNVTAIVESLARNAQYRPIVVNQRNQQILAGNHTWQAAKKLGWTHLAVTYVDVDDQQAARIVAVDNRANDIATYDFAELQALLETLPDLTGTGYTEDELNQLLNGQTTVVPPVALTDPDDVPEPPDEPVAKLGDLWMLGPHRVLCGDSTDMAAVEAMLAGDRADCMWTDPPYGVNYIGKTADALTIQNDGAADLPELLAGAFTVATAALHPGAPVYVAHPPGALRKQFWTAFEGAGWDLRQELVWIKSAFALGRSDYHYRHEPVMYGFTAGGEGRRGRGGDNWHGDNAQDSVFEIAKPSRNADHPTMKPVELMARMIGNSCPVGGLVYEPFGGSGSTLIAAHGLNMTAAVVELDPRYVDVICRRWFEHTGIEPVLADRGEST
jgi:DNA modification methylase